MTSQETTQIPEDTLEQSLRPKRITDFSGQPVIKRNLSILIQASKNRNEPVDHVLFYGPPGLGKTTLAAVIASEMGVNIRMTSGPAIERSGDLAAVLTSLEENDILFIDEIHRLNKTVEETLYPAMEDYALDIVVGKGPAARTLRLDLPKFTLIGATTRIGAIASPLRDRFGAVYRLQFYDESDLKNIIMRSAKILHVSITKEAAQELAQRSRKTPRIANRLLRRVRDFAEIENKGVIDETILHKALDILEVDSLGLDHQDRQYLKTIIEKFNGGPVGIDTIATTMADDATSIEEVAEPFLLQLGFVKRTKQGRVATKKAFEYLGVKAKSSQKSLF